MFNLHSLTKGQAAIIALIRVLRDLTGNQAVLPSIFPDYFAPRTLQLAKKAFTGVDPDIPSILGCCIWNWRFCRVGSVWL
jgi:hypothetical protein